MPDGRDGRRLGRARSHRVRAGRAPDVATEVGNIDVGPLFGLPPVSILRPADFLALRFSFTNLQLTGSGDAPRHLVRRTANRAAYLTVEFPSQHITELALFETAAGIPVKTPEPPAGDTNRAARTAGARREQGPNDDPFPLGRHPGPVVDLGPEPARVQGDERVDPLHARGSARGLFDVAAQRRAACTGRGRAPAGPMGRVPRGLRASTSGSRLSGTRRRGRRRARRT